MNFLSWLFLSGLVSKSQSKMEEAAQEQLSASLPLSSATISFSASSGRNLFILIILGSSQHLLRCSYYNINNTHFYISNPQVWVSWPRHLVQEPEPEEGSLGVSWAVAPVLGVRVITESTLVWGTLAMVNTPAGYMTEMFIMSLTISTKVKTKTSINKKKLFCRLLGPVTPNSSCNGVMSSSPVESSLLSPPSPSQCSNIMNNGQDDSWRGSSIASLRRRAFEHSGISMSVFR